MKFDYKYFDLFLKNKKYNIIIEITIYSFSNLGTNTNHFVIIQFIFKLLFHVFGKTLDIKSYGNYFVAQYYIEKRFSPINISITTTHGIKTLIVAAASTARYKHHYRSLCKTLISGSRIHGGAPPRLCVHSTLEDSSLLLENDGSSNTKFTSEINIEVIQLTH